MSEKTFPLVGSGDEAACPHCGAEPLLVYVYEVGQPTAARVFVGDLGGFGLHPDPEAGVPSVVGRSYALMSCAGCGRRISAFEPPFLA